MAKKRGGLGKGVDAIDLKEPHGLAPTVPPPPPPPGPSGAEHRKRAAPKADRAEASATWLQGSEPDLPVVDVPEPEPAPELQPSPVSAQPKVRKLDPSLLPWIIKKQIAGETDREDLDFRVIFSIRGYPDRLVMEGHRNDFGKFYAGEAGNLGQRYLRWGLSGFSKISTDDALVLLKDQIEGILVESDGYAMELGSVDDLLDWCSY